MRGRIQIMVGSRSFLLALLLLVLVPASAAANTGTQIIVKRDAGLSASERADIRADAGVRLVDTLSVPRTEVVAARPGDVADALRDLNADPDVAYAERNRPVRALATNDTFYDNLWGLENDGTLRFDGPDDWGVVDADMDVPEAWTHSTGAGRTVAVVDSGVDADHPDLAGRVVPGWDFVDDDPDADDEEGHGTHVAGTLAATRENAEGIAGVAPDVRILPLRVLDADGQGLVSDVLEAYQYAADQGVAVVNASLGGEGFLLSEYQAIADNPDTLFVVAAGNRGKDNDVAAQAEYPCSYNLGNILCVGASRHDDEPADFSNYGANTVDVFAPGYGIYSTIPGGGYDWNSGTSMATPHVAGLAALLLAQNPALMPTDVKDAIMVSTEQKASLDGLAVTEGRANADNALTGIDFDTDSFVDGDDNCPGVWNFDQADGDGDGVGDACPPDADADGDAVAVPTDECPDEPAAYAADGCPSADPTSDGDYWPDALDACPGVAGPINGCPDSDGDGVADASDNCVSISNANQSNRDGDPAGDVCDADDDNDGVPDGGDLCPTPGTDANGCTPAPPPPPVNPAPADRDGDGVYDVQDACPTVPAATSNGCPLAQVTKVTTKPRKRGSRRSATITVNTSAQATVRITVERKRGRKWVRVARKTLVTSGTRARITVSRLKRGSHRVRITISSSAGRGTPVTEGFRVR